MTAMWCANLTLLYREFPFLDRAARAAEDGFTAVEFWWPTDVDLDALAAAIASAGVEVALVNLDSGDMESGERGFFNRPEMRPRVLESVRTAVEFATEVGCQQLNAPVGTDSGADKQQQLGWTVEGLKEAADLARPFGIRLNVEALNKYDNPSFLIHSTREAMDVIAAADAHLGLQFDVYHMARMGEDIVSQAFEFGSKMAHVQIADVPGRNEPGSGSLPIVEFVDACLASGYTGVFALEYLPSATTREGLEKMRLRGVLD